MRRTINRKASGEKSTQLILCEIRNQKNQIPLSYIEHGL